jgi:hypothetical protein
MCKNFIVKACVGIRKRHSVNDKILITTAKFDLERVISSDREKHFHRYFLYHQEYRQIPFKIKKN